MEEITGQNSAEKARLAFRANPHGSFEEQAQHLRCLLEHLPVLGHNAATLQAALCGEAAGMDREQVLTQLQEKWVCHRASQEGAIHAEIGDETDQLVITFYMYLWSKTSAVGRFQIVRRGEDDYLYWDRGQAGELK